MGCRKINTYQFLTYLPFGDSIAEQKIDGYSVKYRFTGRACPDKIGKLDGLSGLYYFVNEQIKTLRSLDAKCNRLTSPERSEDCIIGYYDPRLSVWYGVDPLAEKYPQLNSFNYAENSPISLIDVWGTQGIPYSSAGYIKAEVEKIVRAVETGVVRKAELADKKVQELKQSIVQPIVDNKEQLIKTCEFLESVCAATKDAALLTTVATGGTSAEITMPLAGAAALGETTMQGMKGGIKYFAGDKDGNRELAKNVITETIEFGLDKASDRIPMAPQTKAATQYFIEKIPGKAIDQIDNFKQRPKPDNISKQKYELTVTDGPQK